MQMLWRGNFPLPLFAFIRFFRDLPSTLPTQPLMQT